MATAEGHARRDEDERFDYIIVGSGAGGGPLAARLVEAGKKVLVLEAGSHGGPADSPEISQVPGLHAASTEDPALSWRFFVEHYSNPPAGPDPKRSDPAPPDPQRTGIFYPRAAALGGCTVHNAMITIAGPDSDWDDLANYLEDDSWRSPAMRTYFQKLERNEYLPRPRPPATSWHCKLRDGFRWLIGKDVDHTGGRHGFDGWLHTSVLDLQLGLNDRQLIGVLRAALRQAKSAGLDRAWTWIRTILRGRASQALDPNHATTQAESPEGVVLIPLAVCGERTTIHEDRAEPNVRRGRRSGPRERLLAVREANPLLLEIRTDCLVTRVLFAEPDRDGSGDPASPPRVIGVEYLRGERLYRAHVDPSGAAGKVERAFVKDGGEVVLCGGTFNTPQLLMLSGIGDAGRLAALAGGDPGLCALRDAESRPIAGPAGDPWRVDLRGVGCNLQDRYEVSLISGMKAEFDLLKGATLGLNSWDPHLRQWREEGAGLYSTNGAVLGIFKRSSPELAQPDLFLFGAPFPFRGYEPGYSMVGHQHDKFTWVILKGGTRNNRGTVRLRSADPRDTPEINFRYFNEPDQPDASWPDEAREDPDLLALVRGVKFVRGISRNAGLHVERECHPGLVDVPTDDDEKIKTWILREAWGHHACGTCRMGPDEDPSAVLDSRFRVLGVRGLRVVDASIFPRIPGYFLVTNIYMASEKAADVMLEDATTGPDDVEYPAALRARESGAIGARRTRVGESPDASLAGPPPATVGSETREWPRDLTGLALSGGGVRSATFNLGVLQAMARARRLRKVDFLSTVSGGGYIGSFLGRCFDRLRHSKVQGLEGVSYPPGPAHVEGELADPTSFELAWLRRQSNYLAPAGLGDETLNAANYFRNLLSVHLVVGLLIFTMFGTMAFVRYTLVDPAGGALRLFTIGGGGTPVADLIRSLLGPFYSPWFLLFEAALLLLVIPLGAGYWIVSPERHERFHGVGTALLGLVAATLLYLGLSGGLASEPLLLGLSLLLAFWHVELAWRKARNQEAALGAGDVSTRRLRTRNILTYELGFALTLAAGAFALAVADALGFALQRYAARRDQYGWTFSALLVTVAGLAPLVRMVAGLFLPGRGGRDDSSSSRDLRAQVGAGLLAAALFAAPMILYSYAAHAAYGGGAAVWRGGWATAFAAALTAILALPGALTFVNRSSFSQMYAARLARAYLGATNPERRRPEAGDVTEVVAGDDVASLEEYRPHETGGPLHLINLTVNQTVDFSSLRGNRARKGESLAVSPIGMSVGVGWHSAWGGDADPPGRPRGRVRVETLGAQPGSGHPSLDVTGRPSGRVEMLPLREWVALSGAAVGPARGQGTRLGTSLLFGLANLRTGRWWDSGLALAARRGFPEVGLLRRILYVGPRALMTQTLLLSEWLALYPGPWGRYWHVSDGGFFENLGAYELIRRRVPRMIVCDASADPAYTMDGLGELIRKVRIDFDARVEPVPPGQVTAWMNAGLVPAAVAARLGALDDLKPSADGLSRRHATLFRVHYGRGGEPSYLLYLKAGVTGDEDPDVLEYKALHGDFPHESTVDQFFDEAQWESYRRLGEHAAGELFGGSDWFWKIP